MTDSRCIFRLVIGIWYLVFGIWYLVFGKWEPVWERTVFGVGEVMRR